MSESVDIDMRQSKGADSEVMFQLAWYNLSMSLTVPCDKQKRPVWSIFNRGVRQRPILQPMSGTVSSGTLTALMGPSGAGKSTLLNVITGKIKPDKTTCIDGQCFLSVPSKSSSDQRISFVPQRDTFFRSFTVRETLFFACKINNPLLPISYHEEKIQSILDSIGLREVANNPLSKLSGGQLKRVNIASEMISNPTILVLDEPTSGLDSDAAENLIKLLKDMSRSTRKSFSAPAILCTIHSPSYDVFATFDSIYLLNKNGGNIYNGSPMNIARYFKEIGFTKLHGNPADFAIEVANGKYGESKFGEMQHLSLQSVQTVARKNTEIDMIKFKQEPRCSTVHQVVYLTLRSLASCFIKSPQSVIVTLMHLATSLLLVHLPASPVGHDPICWEYARPWDQIDRSNFTASDLIYEIKLQLYNQEKMKNMAVVSNFVYFSSSYLMFIHATIAAVLMPFEMPVVRRELTNSYYTVKSYFLSKFLCDSLVILVTVLPAGLYLYFVSGQLVDLDNLWRLPLYALIVYITSLTWSMGGLAVGLYIPDILFAIAVVVSILLTNMFLSEFFMTVNLMAWYFAFLPSIMPLQAYFALTIITLYGYHRCDISGTLKTITLSGFDSPKDSFAKLWWFLNFDLQDMRRQASIYDLEVDYTYTLYDYVVKWLGQKRDLSYATFNYMLDFYHFSEDLTKHFAIAISWLFIVSSIFWHALSTRSKLNRL